MARLLLTGTYGPENSTRATLPFHVAKGAIEAGHEVSISLMADGPFVMKNDLRDAISGVAMPPLKDLFQFAVEKGVRVYV